MIQIELGGIALMYGLILIVSGTPVLYFYFKANFFKNILILAAISVALEVVTTTIFWRLATYTHIYSSSSPYHFLYFPGIILFLHSVSSVLLYFTLVSITKTAFRRDAIALLALLINIIPSAGVLYWIASN